MLIARANLNSAQAENCSSDPQLASGRPSLQNSRLWIMNCHTAVGGALLTQLPPTAATVPETGTCKARWAWARVQNQYERCHPLPGVSGVCSQTWLIRAFVWPQGRRQRIPNYSESQEPHVVRVMLRELVDTKDASEPSCSHEGGTVLQSEISWLVSHGASVHGDVQAKSQEPLGTVL